jgi:hypothetical protein
MRFLRFWLVPAVLIAALAGCEYGDAPQGQTTDRPSRTTAAPQAITDQPANPHAAELLSTKVLPGADGLKAVVNSGHPPGAGPEVELNGMLDKDGAGCVILQASDGNDYTLLFPEGTSLDADTLVLPDGQRLTSGDSIVLKGTRMPADESLSMCLNYARLLSVGTARVPT